MKHQSNDMENQTGENSSICIESLVCEACWSVPFAFGCFQQAIVRNPEDFSGGFSYTTTWEKIQNSADEGCNWCNLLAFVTRTRARTDTASKPLEEVVEVQLRVDVASVEYVNSLSLFIDSELFGAFDIYADHGDEAANYIGTGDFVRHRVSFADYNVASEWINKCAGHEFCRKQEEIVLPTRVIDCSQPEKPRLLITNGLQGFYAALSYVWGGRQSQCTTMANVDSYVQGINVPLPQTIVDAMVATHKLGLRYLWVDSLCILQDSDDDKLKEIVQMRAIYENALITIIAASAYGANEGFLQDQQPTIRLPFQCPAGKVGSMLVQCKPCFDDRSLGVESGGINNRAWCLQEGILSPRQLIFSSPILIFRCRTIVANISSGFRVQTEPQAMETHLLFPNNSNVSLSDDQLSSLRSLWHQILADYPGRGMSMPSDKLVAIAGVVEAFQQVWGGNCIAGLWQQTLIEDLLWRRFAFSDSPLFPRPANYRAPSWSWAAIDGNILPHSDHFTIIPTIEYECEILECKTTPKSDLHPLGEVTDGILRINAKMEKVVWDPINCSLVEPGSLWNGTVGTSADPRTRSKDQVYPDSADEVTESIGEVWLVLMRLGKTSRSGEPWAHGLFVVPVDLEGCFCRIGTLYCCCVPDWYETTPRRIITIV